MNDDSLRMMELGMQGFRCSHILLLLALEAQGKRNPDLIRAMSGLVAGLGSGKTCGVHTGGCCLLGLYAGKGTAESHPDERLGEMLRRFVDWFDVEYTRRYGGINCSDILADDPRNQLTRCPSVLLESLRQLKSILQENGYDFAGEPEPA
jgi:hypothetical protein